MAFPLRSRRLAWFVCWLVLTLSGVAATRAQVPKLFPNGVGAAPAAKDAQTEELVRADLLADTTAVTPGKPFTVGLRLRMAPHWHTYWQYSGDAGLPTKIDWQLPEGYKAGPIQWPLPDKIVSPGDIVNYGYSDETMLLVEITPPANLPVGDVTLKGKASWLVCRESCVPGSKELELRLQTGIPPRLATPDIFERYRAKLPKPYSEQAAGFAVERKADGAKLVLTVGTAEPLDFFPLPQGQAEADHPVVAPTGDGKQTVTVPVSSGANDVDKIAGVLVVGTGTQRVGWVLPATAGDAPAAAGGPVAGTTGKAGGAPSNDGASGQVSGGSATGGNGQSAKTEPEASGTSQQPGTFSGPAGAVGSLWHFLLVGFLGGLILNVMPCVLPVISLKLFSFVKQAHQERGQVLRLGLAYAAGVFAWFLGFAALVVSLQAAGHRVGYAFHLQNPWFLVGLSAVTFVFALNLLGVFEIILPGSVSNAAGTAAGSREGYAGAFLQGMLATVLGSACVAPFFGSALAFAFSQNGPTIFAVFAAIAAGMSAPFVLLAAQPGWMKFLPKPGAWTERVKQAMGFLLLGTVLWLLFSLGRGKGPDAVVWTGVLLLVLAAACWVQGTFNTLVAADRTRWLARLTIAILVIGGGWLTINQIAAAKPPVTLQGTFADQLAAAQRSGRPVFVDLTAEWCVSCKSNEKLVLSSEAIQKAFEADDVLYLVGDYTTYSEDIATLLRQFNAPSVPLYVLYPAGRPNAPIVLPPLLTKQAVLDALATANGKAGQAIASR